MAAFPPGPGFCRALAFTSMLYVYISNKLRELDNFVKWHLKISYFYFSTGLSSKLHCSFKNNVPIYVFLVRMFIIIIFAFPELQIKCFFLNKHVFKLCWSTNKWRVSHTCSYMLRNWLIAPRDICHYNKNTSITYRNIVCYCNILSVNVFCLNFLFCLAFFCVSLVKAFVAAKQLLNSSSQPHAPPVKDL